MQLTAQGQPRGLDALDALEQDGGASEIEDDLPTGRAVAEAASDDAGGKAGRAPGIGARRLPGSILGVHLG